MFRKFVLLLFATSVIFVSSFKIHQVEDGKAHVRSCVFKIGISPLEVNRLRKGDFSESDEKSHCFLKCIFEKSGFLQNETLVESVIIEKLGKDEAKEEVQEMFNLCKDVEHENSCELAFKVYECYWANKKP